MTRPGTGALRDILRQAGAAFRLGWRPLLVTDLAFKLLAFAVLGPLAAAALRLGVSLSGRAALADQEILAFALRPLGLFFLVLVAGVVLAIVALEQASLMAIGVATVAGVRPSTAQALRWSATRALPVLRLAWRLVARTLLLVAPFGAGIAAVYYALLREHDINYYLKERPPAFVVAAALAALLLAGLVRVLLPRLVDWALTLPLVLFENASPRAVLAESRQRIAGARGLAGRLLLLWGAGALLLSFTLPPLLFALGRALAPRGLGDAPVVLYLMLVVLVLWLAANALVSWLNASGFALLLVGLFGHCGGSVRGELEGSGQERSYALAPGVRLPLGRFAAALAVIAAAAGALGLYLFLGVRGEHKVVVLAHRGASAHAPENSLAAVEKAIEMGADYVEIDVQESADGEVVVAHDSDFMKVARVPARVWETSWADLQKIDIGSGFGPAFAGERVPRLRDVLERARGRTRVTIELKDYGHGQRLEQRVIEEVERADAIGNVVVMSLEYDAVRRMRELRPGWTVGLLAASALGDLTRLDADFFAVNAGLATRGFVRRAHAAGRPVYVWTVDDPVRMFQLANRGADGIITNRPGLAREVLARRARMGSVERLLVGLAFYFGAAAPDLPGTGDGA